MIAKKVVKVQWVDSMSDNGRWVLAEDLDHGITECVTFGFLVEENEKYIAVAQTLGMKPEQYCHIISIPHIAITHLSFVEDVPEEEEV